VTTTDKNTKPRLGFIGLGRMGSRMAERLLDAGYQLGVYDRKQEKTQGIARKGASVHKTPRDLASHSDIVLSCVTNDTAIEAVMFGQEGALAGARAGMIFIDLSTVSPVASRKLFQAAKERGCAMIDAAVSGSVPQVQQGSLLIFVGGEQDTYQKCKPVLAVLGQEIFYMGPSGMGTSMKLVVNTLLGLGLQAVAEAISLGEKSGIDKQLLLDALGETTVISPGHKSKLENIRKEEYPANFALSLMCKDFELIQQQAAALSVPMPATAAAQQMYNAAQAKASQAHEEDYAADVRFMEELAGLSVHTS
jgi:3-hydroxyisobutyrate dehydrogenase-like beta-hydroxyacid dehydrogenase